MDLPAYASDWLDRHSLTETAGVVAVSGGPDSVALAHLLAKKARKGTQLFFAHVNHQLRGAESDADEAFVTQLGDRLQVLCRTTRIDMASLAERERANLEGVARRERYRWLAEVAKAEGAAWVATGHTADDQAETVLFRLLRGSGVLGLGGMRACRALDTGVSLVRPLLNVRRQALLDYLNEHHIDYRIDATNRDLSFARNRLRHELLPRLQEEYNPAIVDVLCRLAEQARELHAEASADAARLLAEAELPRAGDMLVFSVPRLKGASANRLCEMFRLVWHREGWPMADMDFERWRRLAALAAGPPTKADVPGLVHVRREGNVIQLQSRLAR